MESEHDPSRSLRIASIVTFLPAFPLCLVHGIITGNAVPAVGLVPLAFSAGLAVWLLFKPDGIQEKRYYPVALFGADAILAAALMVVLVFTWIDGPRYSSSGESMLASYATVPLLANFLIHLWISLKSIYFGLGINHLIEWLAWQAAPAECPNCRHQLRPARPTWSWKRDRKGSYARLFTEDVEERYRDDEGESSHVAQV